MKPLIVLIVVVTALSCKTEGKKKHNTLQGQEAKLKFEQVVQTHFQYIDSVRKIDPYLIEGENLKVQQTLIRYKDNIFSLGDTLDFDWIYLVKSLDEQFCLVSWDTRMGGTMIEYATMALFKNSKGEVSTKMLVDTTHPGMENTLMHYDTIQTVQNNDNTFYLAHGFGQGSTALPWQELKAFKIKNNQLINLNVFPNNEPNLLVEFDTHEFGKDERIPTIKIRDGGRAILIPIATEKEGFSGKYETLILKGQVYKPK